MNENVSSKDAEIARLREERDALAKSEVAE